MGDFTEIFILTSIGITAAWILTIVFKDAFDVRWRRALWFLICVRLFVPFHPTLKSTAVYPVIPMSSAKDAVRIGVWSADGFTGFLSKILPDIPLVYIFAGILEIAALFRIIVHHEEYGIVVNRLYDSLIPVTDCELLRVFERLQEELGIRRHICLYQSDRITSPLIIGCIHVGIIIPSQLMELDTKSQKYMLTHELMHYRYHDVWYKRFVLLVCDLYWFNPFAWLLRYMSDRDLEFCCDRRVTEKLSDTEKKEYCRVLLKLAGTAQRQDRYALNISRQAGILKKRMDYILNKPLHRRDVLCMAVVIILMLCAGSIQIETNPAYEYGIMDLPDSVIAEVTQICEMQIRQNLSIPVYRIAYSNDLKRNIRTRKELQEAIHIYVELEDSIRLTAKQEDYIRSLINSYFSVDMDIVIQ